ncbi:MAG: KEOPS complex subunit Pcc1 [Methanobacterium sp.]
MEIKSKIKFKYRTPNEAKVALVSINTDNMNCVNAYVQNNSLICDLESRSLKTLLATIDDLLFCEMMAEKIIDFTVNQ